jgi:CRISPR-associated protein Csb2
LRTRTIATSGLDARRLTAGQRRTLATLPLRLIDALRNETGCLRAAGWNLPPGGRMTTWLRSEPVPAAVRAPRTGQRRTPPITTARLALAGRPLPHIEDAIRVGEAVRNAAIGSADRLQPGRVPIELSGHGFAGPAGHRHAFYLPEDADDDGFIDHVLIHAPGTLSGDAVRALARMPDRGLWLDASVTWQLILEGVWSSASDSGSRYGERAGVWRSATPYLRPWHRKRGFGTAEQIGKECASRGLPHVESVTVLPAVTIRGRPRRPVHFHRFRSRSSGPQPDAHGSVVEVAFAHAVAGPLALGYGCHYGLGIFVPVA